MRLQRGNYEYLRVGVAGRLVVNIYRSAPRLRGVDPLAVKCIERTRFDWATGVLFHVGHVVAYFAVMGDGPVRRQNRP